jgi:hypothetical protein
VTVAEIVRWYLEVTFLVVTCFALGAGAMAVALRLLLPEAGPEPEPDAPTYTVGASS